MKNQIGAVISGGLRYDRIKTTAMENFQQYMVVLKKNEGADALKEIKRFAKNLACGWATEKRIC